MSSNNSGRLSGIAGSLRRFSMFHLLFGILAVLLFIQLIRLVWLLVTPLGPVGDWRANEVQVMPQQSRLALFNSFDPFYRDATVESGNVVTSLQLTLYGVRMNEASGLGSAILAGPDGVQDSYAVGEEIMSGVSLDSVQFDHVTIDRSGVKESLYLDQSVPAETVDPGLHMTGPPVSEPATQEVAPPLANGERTQTADPAEEQKDDPAP